MELNKLIFPAPKPTYTINTFSTMVWIPQTKSFSKEQPASQPDKKISLNVVQKLSPLNTAQESSSEIFAGKKAAQENYERTIPCNYQQPKEGSDVILIYFHGNAEDIGMCANFTRTLSEELKMNILSVEYPGYGVCKGITTAKTILQDAETIFDFLVSEIKIKPQKIYLLGRSIGSGPATYLAANRSPGLLILMSAYTSIRDIVRSKIGPLAQFLVAERFRNIEEIQKVTSACFFIHGSKDTLISSSHTIELFKKSKALSGLSIREDMTHNGFNVKKDIVSPILGFLSQIGHKHNPVTINFPNYMIPEGFLRGEHNNDEEETRIQQTKISLMNNNYLTRLHHST